MNYQHRVAFYNEIEESRNTKLIAYVTGDRPNADTQIGADCIDLFVDILDEIGPTQKISLLLHTNGGNTAAAWRLVNLIKTFCEDFEVLIPYKAMSAGTLISLGAQNIVMSKQAALGPIDPSLIHPLGPSVPQGNVFARLPVSVEAVRGYLDTAAGDLGITDSNVLGNLLMDLSNKVHPLVLGEIFRSRAQIRFLAEKLLSGHVTDPEKVKPIVDFLCADSGSHDYTINRREAIDLGLPVEKPSEVLYNTMKNIHRSYSSEMQLAEAYNPHAIAQRNKTVPYCLVRGVVESAASGAYAFVSEGNMVHSTQQDANGNQIENLEDRRNFEGWKKI